MYILPSGASLLLLTEVGLDFGKIIPLLLFACGFIAAIFILPYRFAKIACACISEFILYYICRTAFGMDAIITQVMCWLTTAMACILTVSIVNRIHWGNLRGRPDR